MADSLDPLILDMIEWLAPGPRDYHEVLEVWRTSCPRLPVWEEAVARGLVRRTHREGRPVVSVTGLGARLLAKGRGASERHVFCERGSEALELEVVRPARPGGRASVVVFFHGGGWRAGSREQFLPQCHELAASGVFGITASYRLVSEANGLSPIDCVRDAAEAVGWVRAHASTLGIDPTRIAAGGGSAGGHLAVALAAMGVELAALVLFNPALAPDGTPRWPFLGDAARGWTVRAGFPPTLVQHGTEDRIVPIANVRSFAEKVRSAGSPCTLLEYEGMPHAFFNEPAPEGRYETTLEEVKRFLGSLGLLG